MAERPHHPPPPGFTATASRSKSHAGQHISTTLKVKIDHRWTGAREVMQELRDGANGGIPWYAILDSEGQVLVTSNETGSEQNIGYPGSQSGRMHFAKMLNSTRQRMTEEDVKQLIEALADESESR